MSYSINPNHPRYLNLYFQVHQPKRLRPFRFFDIGSSDYYFDDDLNDQIIRQVAQNCYLPTNILLLKLIYKYPEIRITFSISGVALEQLERCAPSVIESFRMMASSGSVEFLSETYHHSLSSLMGKEEFKIQVARHAEKMENLIGVRPTVFRNTELIYSDDIGRLVHQMGFKGILLDGIGPVLGPRTPHHLYRHPDNALHLLLRNYRLSDDIAFRYSQKDWIEAPLTSKKYIQWLENIPDNQALINLGMDYETFGEHQKADSGIFTFLEEMITTVVRQRRCKMVTPSEAIRLLKPVDELSVPNYVSWADNERDLSAWLGNDMQCEAFDTLKELGRSILSCNDNALINTWRYLQTSDHFYYMSTKVGDDGNVHSYFSPYASPYEAFINYMNVLSDLTMRIKAIRRKPIMSGSMNEELKNVSLRPESQTTQLVA